MNISKICIEKPVLTIVISLVLILLGILGFKQLQLRSNPDVFRPKLVVSIEAPGSSAQFMEQNVTIPIENALESTPYLSFSRSTSSQNYSEIDLYFKNIAPEEFLSAQSYVLQAVDTVQLPQNAKQPQISTSSHNDQQILIFAVSSTSMDQQHLVDYVANNIVKRLQEVPGVGGVQQWSSQDALRVALNPIKMAELSISVNDVINALQVNDISAQAGLVVNSQQAIPINLESHLTSVQQFQNIIIAQRANRIIRLKDIANIHIGNQSFAGAYTFYNSQPGVAVSITADDNANPIELGKQLRTVIANMELSLPPGTHVHLLWDQAKILQHSVEEVFWTIFEAVVLVALVTLLFLGRMRFALIPVTTIPICIISAFSIMWLLGFSINLMTLLALVLAVGLVVDDAIVVLENCHRHVEAGKSAFNAAIHSMKEITFPVIGMTVSIIAVYVPTAFMNGKTAVYFQQFAFTLAGSVFISGIIALTLTPMMCSRLMTHVSQKGYDAFLEKFFYKLRQIYQAILAWVLRHTWIPLALFLLFLTTGGYLFTKLPTTLIPKEYGGYVFLGIQTPQTASVAYTEMLNKTIIDKLIKLPQVKEMMSFGGGDGYDSNFAANIVHLSKKYQSFSANANVANYFTKLFSNVKAAQIFSVPMNVNGESGNGSQPGELSAYVIGFSSYPNLAKALQNYTNALEKTGIFQQVTDDLKYNSQQLNLDINRAKAIKLGVNVADIDSTISTDLGGYVMNNGFQFEGVNYPVIVGLPKNNLQDLSILNDIYINNSSGQRINLNQLVTVKPSINIPQRTHINSMRAGEIDVVAKPGITDGHIINTLEKGGKEELPAGMSLAYPQQVQDMIAGNYTLILIFVLGIIFIYLVLAALFESFIDPLIILLTVPLCIVGALAVLYFIGGSLNIYTGIGLVTLIGLVSKHGVLITQFANDLRKKNQLPVFQAILEAASIRIRPILMTTATMVVGAIPLVIATGVGSNSRSQIGSVIIAGLLLGTFFSLFIVPVAYLLLAKLRK